MTADNHTSEIPLKRCLQDDRCINPDGPLLPATIEYFALRKRSDDGLSTSCIACRKAERKAYRARYYQENREKNDEQTRAWVATHPSQRKDINNASFHRHKNDPSVIEYRKRYDNGVKRRAYRKAWRLNNPDKARGRDRRSYLRHRERYIAKAHKRRNLELAADGSHTANDIRIAHQSQKGLCWWCSKPVGIKYHVDHRIPLDKGGSNDARNICISCPNCNLSKGAKMPYEFNGRLL